jgi:hypothetical protein
VPTVTHPVTECGAPPVLTVHDARAVRQAALAVLGATGHIVLASAASARREPVAP